jgi:hypothetical protein
MGVRPAGYLTLAGAVDDLTGAGFNEHFGVGGDALRSFDSGKSFRAEHLVIREYHRFEGVSDPDDMSIVYAIEGQGDVRGTLVDAFGAYSDPAVSAFLERVPIRGADRVGGGGIGRSGMLRGSYRYGVPIPVAADPWHDEGGEGGVGP